jgi:hydroxymethylpyrimidine pyrophosphatase-like HAD family hydrolase
MQVIAYLQKKHFLIIENGKILPTPLGKAAFASSISPEESVMIFQDLVVTRQTECLVLESDLHLLYLITPHFKGLKEPNWDSYLKVFKRLTKSEQKVAKIYKLERSYIEWAREIKPQLPDFMNPRSSQELDQ